MVLLPLILLFCIAPGVCSLCQHCFKRQFVNIGTQLLSLVVLVLCLASPLLIPDHTSLLWDVPIFDNLQLTVSLYYDPLTWIMICLVSFISLVIHSYASRYLLSDLNQTRFMGQLSMLTFSVMLLMMSGSLFTAFIAWQFIGLSLYLLLNHYHYDVKANKAAKKKFIINRVGDICFLLGVAIALHQFGTTELSVLFAHASEVQPIILMLVFVAIMTKSAQFPFHIWLIDTMEAPTPVSALMHAGVINAGGFLLARMSPLYDQYIYLLMFIFTVGLITALLGNFFMKHQSDIKKQLAYSTMGQMGYMLLQCGLGCFSSAVFHLIAHGFFKGSLFLSSGSTLIQETEQDTCKTKGCPFRLFSLSIITTVLLLAAGYYFLVLISSSLHLNPLIWLFIAITLYQLSHSTWRRASSAASTLMLLLAIVVSYVIYLLALEHFYVLLGNSIAEISQSQLGWIASGVILALLILGGLAQSLLPKPVLSVIRLRLYLFGASKNSVESSYRQYLLNPIRAIGEALLMPILNLSRSSRRTAFGIIAAVMLACILAFLFPITDGLLSPSKTALITALVALMLLLLIANRARSLNQVLATLLLSALCITNIAFAAGGRDMILVGSFQFANSIVIIFGLTLLLRSRFNDKRTKPLTENRLPWCHFYMSLFLMLFIGIPGSASFISEFYMLFGLVEIHMAYALVFGVGVLLLALVILHTLQVHFFNPKAIRKYTTPVTPSQHIVCIVIIAFNIFNGLHPEPLLKLISTTIGA